MKIATICPPTSPYFLPPIERILTEAGHVVHRTGIDSEALVAAASWADAFWCEWALDHVARVVELAEGRRVVARLHRYEVTRPNFAAYTKGLTSLVVMNRKTAGEALALAPDLEKIARFIGPIVDFDRFALQPRVPDDFLRIAVIGNLSEGKRPAEAVSAAKSLGFVTGKPVRLSFVGGGSSPAIWSDLVREAARRLDVEVAISPWTDDVPAVWREHDICLSASVAEGHPYSPIEALACGAYAAVRVYPGSEGHFPENAMWADESAFGRASQWAQETFPPNVAGREWVATRYSIPANRERVLGVFEGRSK